MKIKNVNMDDPRILRSIIIYCIPLIMINLVQSLFNSVDMIMLNMFDPVAVSSVGASSSIIHLLVNSFFGISTGVKVVLSHQIGAHEEIKARKTVSTAVITSLALGILMGLIGFLFSAPVLSLTKCPADCFDGAEIYLKIYCLGIPAIMVYNFASAVITTSGDTQRPLYYMLISGGLNVLLNLILLIILPQKVMAVAIATVLSQMIGAVLAVVRLTRMRGMCCLRFRRLVWNFASFKRIMFNGLPIAFCNALLPFSNLQIQSNINELGSAVVAGNSAASNIEGIIGAVTASTMGASVSVFVGYNLGAQRIDRVKKCLFTCLWLGLATTALLSIVTVIFGRPLSSFFVSDELAIQASLVRINLNVVFYVIACTNAVLSHTIQAFGYSVVSTANSIISVLIFRFFWMLFIYPPFRDLSAPIDSLFMLVLCWPVSWTLMLIANIILTLYFYFGKLKKGKLKRLS